MSRDVGLMYVSFCLRENGLKTDYIVPVDEFSKQIFEPAFPFMTSTTEQHLYSIEDAAGRVFSFLVSMISWRLSPMTERRMCSIVRERYRTSIRRQTEKTDACLGIY